MKDNSLSRGLLVSLIDSHEGTKKQRIEANHISVWSALEFGRVKTGQASKAMNLSPSLPFRGFMALCEMFYSCTPMA
jgi:hypothetical protein